MILRIAFAATLVASMPLAARSAVPPAASVLAQARTATFSRPLTSVRNVRTTGILTEVGLTAPYTEWDDMRGPFVEFTGGNDFLTGSSGYDGHVSWSKDRSGIMLVDGGESTRLQSVDQAYTASFSYFRPAFGGASARYAGRKEQDGTAYDVVSLTPPAGSTIALWIDTRTHLLAKLVEPIGLVTSTTTFSDYRRVDGITLPFHVVTTNSQGNNSSLVVTRYSVNAPGIAALLRVPRSSAHDFSIANGSKTTVPIEVINNHIFFHVMLDGKGPYTFIFDTGGTNTITPGVAAALHARSAGGLNLTGVGNTTEGAQFARVHSVRIGNASIRSQDFIVLPIQRGFGVAEGLRIDGMMGPAIPERFLTTIDYAHARMTLSLHARASGTSVPFFFDGTIPTLLVTVDGVRARTLLDTGNRGQLYLSSPFLASHPTLETHEKSSIAVTGFGVGGPSYGRLGRIRSVRVGPFNLRGVVTDFATQTQGATADPFSDANLGGGVWNRFTLTLDYAHERIWLTPNARYGTAFTYDRSGLFLIDYNGGATVLDALAGTPAGNAGIKKGDTLLAVDGKPASAYTLAQLRALFRGAPGTTLHLRIRSAGAERNVDLTLANYV